MMTRFFRNAKGSVLNVALLLLIMLSLIVIFLSRASMTNMKIANYDKQSKISFHNADGGTEMGTMLIEENLGCPYGFSQNPAGSGQTTIGNVKIMNTRFWMHPLPPEPSDTSRDIYYPVNYGDSDPHTNITIGGETRGAPGAANPMISGYEGLGRAAAVGGSYIHYDIWAQHLGRAKSQAKIKIEWKHVIGLERPCTY